MATRKKGADRPPPDQDDLSIPPSFTKTFYKLLAELAVEFRMSRPQLALKALRLFAQEARKQRSPFHKTLGSEEISQHLREAVSANAKAWWSKIPQAEKEERGRRAAAARWSKTPKSKND